MSSPHEHDGDGDDEGWRTLLAWLSTRHGMNTDRLSVKRKLTSSANYGLFTTRPTRLPETVLFRIPASALLNSLTLSALYPRSNELSAIQVTCLHLFRYRGREAADEAFGPYLGVLPRDFEAHPVSWSVKRELGEGGAEENASLDCLPPSMFAALAKVRERFEEDWMVVRDYLVHSVDCFSTSIVETQATLDFLWAWLNVNTRCIYHRLYAKQSDPANFTLCPILDFANHRRRGALVFPQPSNAEVWDTAPEGEVGDDFVLMAPEGIREGEEVFLRYGSHPNRVLFVEYGFVDCDVNGDEGRELWEVDVLDLVEGLFAARGDVGQRLKAVLVEEGYWGDWTIHFSPAPAHPSFRLMAALRLLHLVPLTITSSLEITDGTLQPWRDTILGHSETISSVNEEAYRRTLKDICLTIRDRAEEGIKRVNRRKAGHWIFVERLWDEEKAVSEAVRIAVESGVEF